jgi:hypothetical protein
MSQPVDYIKMVEALNGAVHAKTAFWPLEVSIILYACPDFGPTLFTLHRPFLHGPTVPRPLHFPPLKIYVALLFHRPQHVMWKCTVTFPLFTTSANRMPIQSHTRGLRFWGHLDFSKTTLEAEKLAFNSLATALLDIPGVTMPIAAPSKHLWHCVVWQNGTF